MASVIRVGQSKFVSVPIDEDSSERIMNCIATLSELEDKPAVHELFLKDTKTAYAKMLSAQEKKAAEKKDSETTKAVAVQVDDLLTFRQFSKKAVEDLVDVRYHVSAYVFVLNASQDREDLSRATGASEANEDFISNLSRISQLTGIPCRSIVRCMLTSVS